VIAIPVIHKDRIESLMKNLLILVALLLAACSGVKPYPNAGNKNFSVKIEPDSMAALLKDAGATLDIYSVNPDCTTLYKGTVRLEQPVTEIALPPGRPSHLVFVLGVLSGSSDVSYKTLLEPRAGYRYMAVIHEATHRNAVPGVPQADTIFDIVIYEMNPGGKKSKGLEHKELDNCGEI
jgi:hypothetical protein